MNINNRKRLLKIFAQTAQPTIAPAVEDFIASKEYPTINTGFIPDDVKHINNIAKIINKSLHIPTGGTYNLDWAKRQMFNFEPSSARDINIKNLLGFSKELYKNFFTNNGTNFTKLLESREVLPRVTALKNSTYLNQITNVVGSSKLGQESDVRDLKQKILQELRAIEDKITK